MTPAAQLMPDVIAVGGYGWLVANLPLIGYGAVTVIGSALILARCWATRAGSGLSGRWSRSDASDTVLARR